jgi:hypothetical protein
MKRAVSDYRPFFMRHLKQDIDLNDLGLALLDTCGLKWISMANRPFLFPLPFLDVWFNYDYNYDLHFNLLRLLHCREKPPNQQRLRVRGN